MIPDYQSLMRPLLTCAATGETRIVDAVELLADKLALTTEERAQLLPSGKQTRFANRVNWAKAYLAKAGLVRSHELTLNICFWEGPDDRDSLRIH